MRPQIVSSGRSAPRPRARLVPRADMALTGVIKWFRTERSFGFITPDDGGPDVFLHISVARQYGLLDRDLVKDTVVRYVSSDPKAGLRPEATAVALA